MRSNGGSLRPGASVWNGVPAERSDPAWRVRMRLESIGLVSKLFKVEDEYRADLNAAGCVESASIDTHEGNRQRETRITFDGARRRANYLERDRVKEAVVLAKETEIPSCVHDVVGGLFFLRTLNLEPGQSTSIPVSDGKKSVMAKVEAQQHEQIKTPAGTFQTTRYEIYLFNDVLFHRPAHLYVWLTDDRRRLPVQIRVRMQNYRRHHHFAARKRPVVFAARSRTPAVPIPDSGPRDCRPQLNSLSLGPPFAYDIPCICGTTSGTASARSVNPPASRPPRS